MSEETYPLKILSYNCNGLKYVSANRAKRIRSIAEYICMSKFDIVCLQEIFVAEDYEYLQNRCRSFLPYSHWFINTSFVGTCGLVTMARWPLRAAHINQFRLQGSPFKPYNGDWFASKSVGYTRVALNGKPSITVHVFNFHLLANYGGENKMSQYAIHRLCQAYEVAHYVETMCGSISKKDSVLVLAGDLNTLITELGYSVIQSRLSIFDCHPCPPKCPCNSPDRTSVNVAKVCPRAAKIDYIMARLGPNLISQIDVLNESGLDSNGKPMSDHLPIAVRITITRGTSNNNEFSRVKGKELQSASRPVGEACQNGCLKSMQQQLVAYLRSQSYRCTLSALLINLISLLAFSATIFLAHFSPLEAILLMLIYLGMLYAVCLVKVASIDSEWKGILRMLSCIQIDLSRYNQYSVILLQNNITNGSV